MRRHIHAIVSWSFLVLPLLGCSGDPNANANKLYTEASQSLELTKTEGLSYSEILDSFESAKNRLDQILTQYPSSNTAVGLSSGNINILGLTLSQFQEQGDTLKILAEYERSPLALARFFSSKIESPFLKPFVLKTAIAEVYAQAGDKNRAEQLLSQALESAKILVNDSHKATAYTRIAEVYAEIGQKDRAEQLLSQAVVSAKKIEHERNIALALVEIAVVYAQVGQEDQAEQMLSQAHELANILVVKIRSTEQMKASLLVEIAEVYVEIGQKDHAEQLISQAHESAEKIELDGSGKASALGEIAEVYAEIGQKDRAEQLLSQVLESAENIEGNVDLKAMSLTRVAGSYAETGQEERARQILFQAVELAQKKEIAGRHVSPWVWSEIAVESAKAGQFGQAVEIAKTIEDASYKARALIEVADSYVEGEQLDGLLEMVRISDDVEFKARILTVIAGEYAERGAEPSEEDMASFHNIVHTISPANQFWE